MHRLKKWLLPYYRLKRWFLSVESNSLPYNVRTVVGYECGCAQAVSNAYSGSIRKQKK